MNRERSVERIREEHGSWDVAIIGGGATGLGTAVDAASRGYRTVLFEQSDFAQGTSSRSTKLVHGGVRYLQQGNVSLVLEALRERGRLVENAPHIVQNQRFVVPAYSWWERPYYGIGLKLYDVLAGKRSFGRSRLLSRAETVRELPGIVEEKLRGGVAYRDGQFDDARLAVTLARTADDLDAILVNYMRVEGLAKRGGRISGVVARELETDSRFEVSARVVVNATGVFVDGIRKMDDPEARPLVSPSQGIHVVLDRSFFPSKSALLIPRTSDGRVLFVVPWQEHVLLGTTDTPVESVSLEPCPFDEEIDYLLRHAARYLKRAPTRADVLSTFAGLRPLVASGDDTDTASISRDHVVRISKSGLITVTGGKWTTYREMGEDVINEAARIGGLAERPSRTSDLKLHGWCRPDIERHPLDVYGADRPLVEATLGEIAGGEDRLHHRLPYRRGEVVWAARHEMARTVEDVLSRRLRALLLDADAAIDVAPDVADLMAEELDRDDDWKQSQVEAFLRLAAHYLPSPGGPREPAGESKQELPLQK